jgi:hypothetical protein
MSSTYFGDLYTQAETGVTSAVVPEGTYDVVVNGARPNIKGNQIWLTLQVLSGPDAGKGSDVSLYFPKPGDSPGARTFFVRKAAGFIAYPDVAAAFQAADNAPDIESGFAHIATALEGKQVSAEITLRKEGAYAGTNELRATKSLQNTPAPAPVAQAAAPVAAPAPVQEPVAVNANSEVPF